MCRHRHGGFRLQPGSPASSNRLLAAWVESPLNTATAVCVPTLKLEMLKVTPAAGKRWRGDDGVGVAGVLDGDRLAADGRAAETVTVKLTGGPRRMGRRHCQPEPSSWRHGIDHGMLSVV